MSNHEGTESDIENIEPNAIISLRGKLDFHHFFEYMGEKTNQKGSLYKCLFKSCKKENNKDGTPKYLKIKKDSR
uniref:Uncharacterized protein n=1 Tax=Daphnia galeata TaxID=27404 RepID=A0A8J2RPQ5_9CRUS|nr:unnamed protein product [Daphnia galeata]